MKSWKNHPQKLLRKTQIHFSFLTAWAAQTAQREEFMFQNAAYRPTIYKTGPDIIDGTTILRVIWIKNQAQDQWLPQHDYGFLMLQNDLDKVEQ